MRIFLVPTYNAQAFTPRSIHQGFQALQIQVCTKAQACLLLLTSKLFSSLLNDSCISWNLVDSCMRLFCSGQGPEDTITIMCAIRKGQQAEVLPSLDATLTCFSCSRSLHKPAKRSVTCSNFPVGPAHKFLTAFGRVSGRMSGCPIPGTSGAFTRALQACEYRCVLQAGRNMVKVCVD